MKIRIFSLAKELGMDSKVLIKHCNDAGVQVKSSALASISPEEKDEVLGYLAKFDDTRAPSDDSAPLAPKRDDVSRSVGGKVRAIKTMSPRAPAPIKRRKKTTDAAESAPVAVGEVADVPPPLVDEDHVPASSDSVMAEEPDPELESAAGVADVGADDGRTDQPADRTAPITREDYVPAAGSAASTIREMKPRGTTSDNTRQGGRAKTRSKAALPNVAAPPTYKPPNSKPTVSKEEPAQKPDMKLTPEILEQQSPLAAHLRKHAEQKKRFGTADKSSGKDLKSEYEASGGFGLIEGRQERRERRKQARRMTVDEPDQISKAAGGRRRRRQRSGPVELKTEATIELPVTIRSLSEAMGRPAKSLMQILFKRGQMVSINESIDEETAVELAMEVGVDLLIRRDRDIEEELRQALTDGAEDDDALERPPIVTILGHVDHGKTSLLDKIRSANVAAHEAGGITQHIASYQVAHNDKLVTFVDTPGHAAFGEMRARGANVTDIVVLVVAADDSVMPQTLECISHAKAADVPIVVAMNKIDLPDTNEQKVLSDLAANSVTPTEWGGDTDVVRTSAITGQGIDDLLETILLTAELLELRCNPDRPAMGACLEAFRDEGRGTLAWLVVQKGTLRIGDIVLCGHAHGRIRAIYNDRDEEMQEAGPSTPVQVAGLDTVPGAGDHFFVMTDLDAARETAQARQQRGRTVGLAEGGGPRTLEDILQAAKGGQVQDLPLILKADSPGSIEALRGEIDKLDHPEVRVRILHAGVGGVNESDVYLASAAGAIVIAFHVIPEDRARLLAERESVDIRRYNIIYEVTEQIKRSLEGLLEPDQRQVATGRALILRTFDISRFGRIAGCRVLSGTIDRSNRMQVIRDQTILNDYSIASLRREKDDVKSVREGMECGIRLEGFNDVKEGDLLEAYRIETVQRSLDD